MRIALQVVQLFMRRLDEAIAIVGERGELAPAEVISGVQRLRVHGSFRRPARAVEERLERSTAQTPWVGGLHQVEHRRHEIDVLYDIGNPPPRTRIPLLFDDQRNVDCFLISGPSLAR